MRNLAALNLFRISQFERNGLWFLFVWIQSMQGLSSPVKVKVVQSCPTLCDPMDYTVCGILQARILEWVDFPFSRGSSQPKDQTQISRIAGRFFTSWVTREAPLFPTQGLNPCFCSSSTESQLLDCQGSPWKGKLLKQNYLTSWSPVYGINFLCFPWNLEPPSITDLGNIDVAQGWFMKIIVCFCTSALSQPWPISEKVVTVPSFFKMYFIINNMCVC